MLLVQLHIDATLIFVMADSATQVFDVPLLSCLEVNFLVSSFNSFFFFREKQTHAHKGEGTVSSFKLAIAMDWFMHFFFLI